MKEKKLLPKRRFKEFQHADAWEQGRLGEVLEKMYNGQTPSRFNDDNWNGDINWLSSGELNRGIVTDTVEKITTLGQKDANLRIIPKGTFVMAITGLEATGTRGNCAILGIDTTLNQSCMALFPQLDKLNTKFLFQWYRKIGEEYGINYTQGTKQQSYNAELVKILPITLPEVEEQKKIGEFLTEFDNLITLHQRKLEKTKALKSAYLAEMFPAEGERVPKRRFAGFTDEWKKFEVNKFADRYNNLRIPITESKRIPGTTPYYGANGIQDYVEGYTHSGEFILLAEDGANNIFDYPVQYVNGKVWVNNHAHVLQAKINKADNKFLIYLFKKVEYKRYLVGGGRSKLNSDVLMSIELLLPTITEQQLIGEFFKKLDESITNQQQKLNKLKAMKQAYLEEMFV